MKILQNLSRGKFYADYEYIYMYTLQKKTGGSSCHRMLLRFSSFKTSFTHPEQPIVTQKNFQLFFNSSRA